MTNPPIPFLGLKMAKKRFFRAFLLSAVPISRSKIVILDQKLIVPNDCLSLFQISDLKWLLSQFKLKVCKTGTFWSQIQFFL